MKMYVNCPCGNKHYNGSIETVNIEEDIFGRDVLTYTCPNTGNEMKALVLIDNNGTNTEYWRD